MISAHSLRTFVATRDDRIMRRVHRWRPPRWIRVWMVAATRLGDGWLWYALGIALLIAGGHKQLVAVEAAGAATASGILLYCAMKRVFRRQRPCEIEPHCWAHILPPDQFSFPSGHSITAFSIALALGHYYPVVQAPLVLIAASIALSRIILGMHYLSDVVAGAVIGCGLGLVFVQVFH